MFRSVFTKKRLPKVLGSHVFWKIFFQSMYGSALQSCTGDTVYCSRRDNTLPSANSSRKLRLDTRANRSASGSSGRRISPHHSYDPFLSYGPSPQPVESHIGTATLYSAFCLDETSFVITPSFQHCEVIRIPIQTQTTCFGRNSILDSLLAKINQFELNGCSSIPRILFQVKNHVKSVPRGDIRKALSERKSNRIEHLRSIR